MARTAIIVFHGIGQHQEFDTLEGVAAALLKREGGEGGVTVGLVEKGEMPVAAATVQLGGEPVDLYEAYWSPWTKGKAGSLTIFCFLTWAGARGLWTILFRGAKFQRFLFGRAEEFRLSLRTGFVLAFVMAFVVAIFATSGALIWVAIGYGTAVMGLPIFDQCLLRDLRTWLYVLLLMGGGWLAIFGVTAVVSRGKLPMVLNVVLGGYMVSTVAGLVPLVMCVRRHWVGHESRPWPRSCGSESLDPWLDWVAPANSLLRPYADDATLGLLVLTLIALVVGLGYFFLIRERFTAYLGDVVAYLGAYRINEYYEVREQIRRRCLALARVVMDRRDESGKPFYSDVVVAGHSLGTVIGYDTMNALLRDSPETAGRISAFLTLGSPLDKAAFLFRTDQGTGLSVRTRLLGAFQPMVSDQALRERVLWVNFYSGLDPISGSIEYYDPASKGTAWEGRVVNVVDRRSSIPVEAHTRYWEHAEVGEVLWMMAQPGKFSAAEIRERAGAMK